MVPMIRTLVTGTFATSISNICFSSSSCSAESTKRRKCIKINKNIIRQAYGENVIAS